MTLTFPRSHLDFSSTLSKRVNDYFISNNIKRTGNSAMRVKTAFMFLLYFGPYALILSDIVTAPVCLIGLAALMSFGLGGIGLSVMHDANHGAYSKQKWMNTMFGYSLNLVGASAFNWKVQHNVLHHTYTNVHDEDEDIISRGVLRLSPHSPWRAAYRYQHIYAWFLYGLMTLSWMFAKDFARLIKYDRNGLAKKQKANMLREWAILVTTKLVYVTYIFVLPAVLTSLVWWEVLLGIFVMHYIAGFILSIIFQPAHVIDGSVYPMADGEGMLPNSWAVHQLQTTTNFGSENKWFSWFIGGLNFQVEHHLFPNVCHIHYQSIAPIVEATAGEFCLPYKNSQTFIRALKGHFRLLKQLGTKPTIILPQIN